MPIEHDPTLVALSLLVAIQASYVGLNLALRVSQAFALNRRLLIAGAALSFAVGIWAMHFIAMLAYDPGVVIGYDLVLTLTSLVVVVVITLLISLAVYGGSGNFNLAG